MATLKNLVGETTNIKDEIVECRDTLKQILIDKKIEDLENENKLSTLIDKVNELPNKKLWLYKNGDECIDVTGGWELVKKRVQGGDNCTIIKNADNIKTTSISSANFPTICGMATKNSIDLSSYTKLYFELGYTYAKSKVFECGTLNNKNIENNLANADYFSAYSTVSSSVDRCILCVNISNIKSSFIGATAGANYDTQTITLYNVWLEK